MSRAKPPRSGHQASDFSIARILSDRSVGHKSRLLPVEEVKREVERDSGLDRSEVCPTDDLQATDADRSVQLSGRFREDGVALREKCRDKDPAVIGVGECVDDCAGDSSAPTGTADSRDLAWLQYTRYRPPRLPRRSAMNGKQPKRRPGLHPRIPFSHGQLQTLEDRYRRSAYLSRRDVMEISASLHLPQSRVKIWFQNRRARDRRESHRCS